jgi:hypothetical protein
VREILLKGIGEVKILSEIGPPALFMLAANEIAARLGCEMRG